MLDINPADIVIHILNIIVLFIVLKLLVYKPVRKFMRARAEGIDSDIASAKELEKQAQSAKKQYEQQLADAKDQAAEMTNDIVHKAQDEAQQIVAEAKEQADRILDHARVQADAEKAQAMSDMRGEIVDIASQLASELLKRKVSADDNRDLTDAFFMELGDGNRAEK